ncbi:MULTISPECIES: (R)-mandelonitrile lyase [unclassified Phenylobacterium]|uniref:(R)-mandelonitrile lyase n=1 Tax=unclassified Phenylobacterium TaxID=2640670 RepID=UPI003ECFAC74
MDITRKAEQKTVEGPAEYFTGKATITGQFQRPAPSRVSGAIVHFEPGARTAWHTHPAGQTLIVTEGVGWTQLEGGPKLEFHAGDILWCPAEHKHWHGATAHQAMTHIAIQESGNGSRDMDGEGDGRGIPRSAGNGPIKGGLSAGQSAQPR